MKHLVHRNGILEEDVDDNDDNEEEEEENYDNDDDKDEDYVEDLWKV